MMTFNALPGNSIVEVTDLVVGYGDRIVLDHVSTSVSASEIRVILGTSGCGKTTLLKAMVGLITPSQGAVKLFGKEMKDPDSTETKETLKKIGILFQNGALLGSLTVGDNVALPLQMHTALPKEIIREIVRLKLAQVDLQDAYGLYPQELSGGMRKRAALARALVLDPPLVFCDEPSAGLDPVTAAGLDNLLLRLREALGITLVVVTHELSSIKAIADSVVFLYEGRVHFQGSLTDALATAQGPLFEFFNRREARHHAEEADEPALVVESVA
jgi:phospholipid/cholesterol/gamma-HCH transport system ATP-binding protein